MNTIDSLLERSKVKDADYMINEPRNKPDRWNGKFDIKIAYNRGARMTIVKGIPQGRLNEAIKSKTSGLPDVIRVDISYNRDSMPVIDALLERSRIK